MGKPYFLISRILEDFFQCHLKSHVMDYTLSERVVKLNPRITDLLKCNWVFYNLLYCGYYFSWYNCSRDKAFLSFLSFMSVCMHVRVCVQCGCGCVCVGVVKVSVAQILCVPFIYLDSLNVIHRKNKFPCDSEDTASILVWDPILCSNQRKSHLYQGIGINICLIMIRIKNWDIWILGFHFFEF